MNSFRTGILLLLTALFADGETIVRIVGMTDKSESEVLGLMGGRLAHVRSDETSASRADDAAFLLTQVLRKDGYADVRVSWRIVGRREILLTVREGGRLSLGDVTVEGVPVADGRKLARLYARPAEKDRPLVASSAPFREEDVETGLSFIRQELNAGGFWNAEASIKSRDIDPATGRVNLVIKVTPGVLHRIGRSRIVSPDGRGFEETKAAAQPYVGQPATTGNLNAMRLAVEEAFSSKGYPDSRITMGRTLSEGYFTPEFFIELGKRVRLNRVHVEGLERTNPDIITRRMRKLEGDWYDEAAMNRRVRGLLATGAFSSVRIAKDEISDDSIDATLHLDEARAREVTVGAGVDSYQGFILRTTYADRNLGGELRGFSTGFEFSTRGVLGETRITDPWLLGSDTAATARVYALIQGREGYSAFETGLEGKLNWKFGDHYGLELLAGYSLVNLTGEGLPSSQLGETSFTQPRIRLTQTLDYRDSPVLPKSGWHLQNPLEFGAAIGDVTVTYVRTALSGGWYHEVNPTYQIGLGGEFGVLIPSGDGADLPIDLRLFNGGSRSVRSFPERELGPSFRGYPTGGEAMWNTNFEVIRSLTGSFKAVAFLDAGTLSRSFEDVGSSEIELAAGLGLRLNLPIGPVRLEYGYNLTRDEGEPAGTLHFAIGVAF